MDERSEAQADLDVVIRGGTIVTDAGQFRADVGVADGRIAAISEEPLSAAELIDAQGMLVLPGGVDMHVHFTPSRRRPDGWIDDFASGSRAAAAGGITTIGNITSPRVDEDLVAAVERVSSMAEGSSLVDFVLHTVITDGSAAELAQIPRLVDIGIGSLKFFMLPAEFHRNIPGFLAAMSEAAAAEMTVMIHCEDGPINAFVTDGLIRRDRGGLASYPLSRPISSELAAVARAAAMCEATGATTYVVHVSSRDALELITRARTDGLPMHAETRPVYLHFTNDVYRTPEAGLFIGSPPIRTADDQQALWDGLGSGEVSTCCSDHAPSLRMDKLDPSHHVKSAPPGLPELETLMPLLFSQGVQTHRLSLERFVAVTATNAARIFGIYPQKGTIAVGSDADLVVWDPKLTRIVRAEDGQSRCDYSPYEGMAVTGWPRQTLLRGRPIYSDGRITGEPGDGRRVRRKG